MGRVELHISSSLAMADVLGTSPRTLDANRRSGNNAPTTSKQGYVTSADGTRIGYIRLGHGDPLVVCHGSYTVADDWACLAQQLSRFYTVYVFDRRGRGRSPYTEKPYSMSCEIDDLAAVVSLAGSKTTILGHGFGGGCTLAYAIREKFVGRIILCEPDHSVPEQVSRGHLPELKRLVARNDLERATNLALVNIVQLQQSAIEAFKLSPIWPRIVQLTRTFANEVSFLDTLSWTPKELRALSSPTLLLGSLTQLDPTEISMTASLVDRIPCLAVYPTVGEGQRAYLQDLPLLPEEGRSLSQRPAALECEGVVELRVHG
jgi:pimeloyl-ACP methyl ester carboxylesterase